MMENLEFGIINNSSIKCMFQLEENDIKSLETVVNLSENEKLKLQSMNRGTSLLYAGKEHIVLKIEASKLEHKFITTDIKDLK